MMHDENTDNPHATVANGTRESIRIEKAEDRVNIEQGDDIILLSLSARDAFTAAVDRVSGAAARTSSHTDALIAGMAAALHGAAYALLRLRNLGGDLSESQKRYQAAALAPPRPGDLVIELSTLGLFGRDPDQDIQRVGFWERDAWEPHEGWERDEHVFYIRRLDGCGEVRWTNANFMRIPASVEDAATFFDPPCACGELSAVSYGTYTTDTGEHRRDGCAAARGANQR